MARRYVGTGYIQRLAKKLQAQFKITYTTAVARATALLSLPLANFSYSATLLVVDFADESVVPAQPATWAWDFNDAEGTSTEQNPQFTFAGAGTFDVVLVVTDANGKTSTVTQSLTVVAS